MSYLLDTNVVSELVRARPAPAVVAWFDHVPDESLYISVLTLGEIRKGIESVADGKRKEALRVWLEHTLPDWFEDRMLVIDEAVAEQWGRLQAQAGRPLPAIDSLLAATAIQHDLRMVTRNDKDFSLPGLEVINPWQ
ncbi:MAG: VapC toxin family PIN domain ribonuclease [Zetaproteobacteria bacterium CG_4_10_14_3_um_filter_54_28]|nr:MAG: VapC toxin family PIN domain ribonuclease [Zetaproteobacteria bacterium CG_4_10_14_3_um_filter_54_28]